MAQPYRSQKISLPSLRAVPTNRLTGVGAFRLFTIVSIWICAPLQVLIEPTGTNIFCSLLAALTSTVFFIYLFRKRIFIEYSLSALMLLGFNTVSLTMPLIVQTVGLRAIDYNLRLPITTFSSLVAVQIVFILTHVLYVAMIRKGFKNPIRPIYERLGLYRKPKVAELWLMGLLGCAAIYITRIKYQNEIQYGDVGAKILESLWFLVPAPYVPFILRYFQPGRPPLTLTQIVLPLSYLAALVFVGVGSNGRQLLFNSFAIITLGWFLALCCGRAKLTNKVVGWTIAMAVTAPVAYSILTDVTLSMAIVRPELENLSASQRISKTVDVFLDNNKLTQVREQQAAALSGTFYSEEYAGNPILNRVMLVKFHDNMLFFAQNLSDSAHADLVDNSIDRFISILPMPMIRQFLPNFDKSEISSSSFGDVVFVLAGGDELGSKKTGSSYAHGWALIGPGYLVVLFIQSILLFVIFDGLLKPSGEGYFIMAPFACLNLWLVFYAVNLGDSVVNNVALIVRDFPQFVLLYAVLSFVLNRSISLLVGSRFVARNFRRRTEVAKHWL